MQHKVIFEWSLISLNSEFSFSKMGYYTKVKELSLPYYLPIAGGRIIRLEISFKSFKNEITHKLFTYESYFYPFKWVQIND